MLTRTRTSQIPTALAIAAAALVGQSAIAGDVHVPGDHPTLPIALNNAAAGDVIILAPDEYFVNVDLSIYLGSGDITITGSGGPDVTTLNGGGLGSVLRITGGQSLNTVIEGVTITGGDASGAFSPEGRGGGAYINGSSATFRNCKFTGNQALTAGGDGGAIFIETGSLVLEDCVFLNNAADNVGGAAYLRTGTTVTATGCHFEGNVSQELGGAIGGLQTNAAFLDCTFLLNGSDVDTEDGGAMHVHDVDLFVDRCRFESNKTWDDGSAMMVRGGSKVEVHNSVFLFNEGNNGTVYAWESGSLAELYHCTMVGNTGDGVACLREYESGNIIFRNGIIWGNTATTMLDSGVAASHSIIEGGFAPGTAILAVDPLLEPDLSLQPASPAIDAADTYVLVGDDPVDHDGNPRAQDDPNTTDTGVPVYGLTADIGAFELQPAGGGPDPCPADTNGDGVVNVTDLLNLLAAWGSCF